MTSAPIHHRTELEKKRGRWGELWQHLEPTNFMKTRERTDVWLMCFKQNISHIIISPSFFPPCSLPSNYISLCLLAGLWCIHLHLLCIGDGCKDGGTWDLWPPLLPGRHLEQARLLHRHGWVSIFICVGVNHTSSLHVMLFREDWYGKCALAAFVFEIKV